jgi:hypothetical protein
VSFGLQFRTGYLHRRFLPRNQPLPRSGLRAPGSSWSINLKTSNAALCLSLWAGLVGIHGTLVPAQSQKKAHAEARQSRDSRADVGRGVAVSTT